MSTDTSTDTSTPALESGAATHDGSTTPDSGASHDTSGRSPYAPAPTGAGTGNAFSITSLVLSGASILLGQGILAVAGLVFGFLARTREPGARAFSTWGIALGFVSLFGWIVVGVIGLLVATPFLLGVPFLFGDWSGLGAITGDPFPIERLLDL